MDVTIPVVLLVAAFYLLVILPTKRRQERAIEIDENVKPGVEIVTTAGLYGKVVSVDSSTFRLEIAPGVVCRYSKMAVLRIVTPESEAKEEAKAAKMKAERDRLRSKGRLKNKSAPAPKPAEKPAQTANGDEAGPKTL
jgi:preprotein translocase subunit YajC